METITRILLISLCSILLSTTCFANSAAVTVEKSVPQTTIFSLDTDCPIIVNNEVLSFDFSKEADFIASQSGFVTASYEMENPTDKALSVQMAFPFIGSLHNLLEDTAIAVDGKEIECQLYEGNPFSSDSSSVVLDDKLDIANILKAISETGNHTFNDSKIGAYYKLDVNAIIEGYHEFAFKIEGVGEDSKILMRTESGMYGADDFIFYKGIDENKTIEIFVLGKDIELSYGTYVDKALDKTVNAFDCKVTRNEKSFKAFIMDDVNRNVSASTSLPLLEEIYKIYVNSIYNSSYEDSVYNYTHTNNKGKIFQIKTDFGNMFYWRKLLVFVYTVDFPANNKVTVDVKYRTTGGRDESKALDDTYIFNYLLNPAKTWTDFKDLTINVKPPEQVPYIVDSSVKFTEIQDGYTTFLEKLPDEDLYFRFYSEPEITRLESYQTYMNNEYSYFSGIVIFVQILLLIALSVLAVIFVRKIIRTIKEGR